MDNRSAASLLLEKEGLCEAMYALTLQLAEAVEAGDAAKMSRLLDQRGRLMASVDCLDEQLQAMGQSASDRAVLHTERTKQVLLLIQEEDTKIGRRLFRELKTMQERIARVKQVKRLNNGYKAAGIQVKGTLFDKRQ